MRGRCPARAARSARDQVAGTLPQQAFGQLTPRGFGVRFREDARLEAFAHSRSPTLGGHRGRERQHVAAPAAQRPDRSQAAAVQSGEERALGRRGEPRRPMIQRLEQVEQPGVVGARLDGERTLPGRRASPPLARTPRPRDPRVPAAATRRRPGRWPRTRPGRASPAAWARCRARSSMTRSGRRASSCARRREDEVPMRAPGRQPGQRGPGRSSQRVSRVGALQDRRERQSVGDARREVLQAVHGQVDRAGLQCVFDLACEDAGAPDLRDGRRPLPIAGGSDDADVGGDLRMGCRDQARHFPRLPQGQSASAGAEADCRAGTRARHGRPCPQCRPGRARTVRAADRGAPTRPPAAACLTSTA